MKKILSIIILSLLLCSVFAVTAFATDSTEKSPCEGCEICNPGKEVNIDDMPEMEFKIDGSAFVESLGYMGKGLVGIFIVTLVIVGVVAILNWHGRSMEKRKQNKKDN